MDHDALFKWLLKNPVILRSFFEEFLPQVANYTDFSTLEYLDKETRTLRGQRRAGDLLVKVRFKGQESAFLIHVEHESRRDREIAWRLLEYVVLDRRASGLQVYPVLVLAGSAGPAPEKPVRLEFPDRCVLTFDFPVIELARQEARICPQEEPGGSRPRLKNENPARRAGGPGCRLRHHDGEVVRARSIGRQGSRVLLRVSDAGSGPEFEGEAENE